MRLSESDDVMKFNQQSAGVIGSAILGAMFVGGCQMIRNEPPDALDDTPIQVDAAMARRDWEQSNATYAQTGIRSTPTLYTFQSKEYPWSRGYSPAFTELPVFLANVVLIPYQAFAAPVWREHEYRAATVPPSYNAMPPLPPASENQLEAPPAPTDPENEAQPMPADQPATAPSGG